MTDPDYSTEDNRAREVAEKRWRELRSYIRLDIERRDISAVLADIVADPVLYRIRAHP